MANRGKLIFALTISFLILIWASAYSMIRIGLHSFHPESLALLRFLVATIFLSIYASSQKIRLPEIRDIPIILMCGFLGITLYHIALNRGQTTVTAGSASIILNSYPIFVAILSSLILREYINATRWAGIILSFIGIVVIALGENIGKGLSPGVFMILASAISLSIFDVVQKKLMKRYTPLELTLYFFGAGTLFLTTFSGMLLKDLSTATSQSIWSVVYLGVVPGAISYFVWSKLLSKFSVTNMSTTLYLVPPVTIIFAFFCLKEIPTIYSLIGGSITLSGVAVVNFSGNLKLIISRKSETLKYCYETLTRRLQ